MDSELEIEAPINLPAPPAHFSAHDRYAWPIVIAELRKEGWVLLKLPELIDKGKPCPRPL